MKIEPKVNPEDLSYSQLLTIVRKVQEALWQDNLGDDPVWLLPEYVDYDITEEVTGLFSSYDLQPVEKEVKEDDE